MTNEVERRHDEYRAMVFGKYLVLDDLRVPLFTTAQEGFDIFPLFDLCPVDARIAT
jgi:hypothetical protein